MRGLNADSKTLLDGIFPDGGAWLLKGKHDAQDKMVPEAEGPVGAFDLPDDRDLYYCVSSIAKGDRRTRPERVRVLVIDDVGKEVDAEGFEMVFPLKPSFRVESSAGSFQAGLIIDGGMEPAEYAALRQAMASNPIWGKAHNKAAANVYRLPQGTHTKSTRGGWKVRLAEWTGLKYSREELWQALGQGATAAAPPKGGSTEDYADPELLEKLVALIPNPAANWDYFVNVGRAIWGASAGLGWEVFEAWAAKYPGSDPDITLGRWESYHDAVIGKFWLLREARQADPAGAEAWVADEARMVFEEEIDEAEVAAAAPVAGAAPHHRTVAKEIEAASGAGLRFNHDTGCWHRFGKTWAGEPATVKAGFNEAWQWVEDNSMFMNKTQIKQVNKADFLNGVETILRQRLAIRQADFDTDPWLLGTPGGTVDLKTGVLRAARADEFVSKMTAVAPAEKANCPLWLRFVREITKGDADAAWFLQQWAGYCLTGDTREQVFLFLYGPGGNGKSVLMDTLGRLLGGYYAKPVADLYFAKTSSRHMQEVAMLAGARMVTVSEVPPNAAWDEGKLKDHTGGGSITANFMRQNSFTFVPQFKLTALGNHQPTFPGGMNAAIKRRFKLMLLDYAPKAPQKDLMAALWREAAEILRWCLDGLCDPAKGWNAVGLMVPAAVSEATDAFVHDQDVFGLWLEQRVEKRPGGKANSTDLFNDWSEFRNRTAGANSVNLINTTTSFGREMQNRGFKKQRDATARGYADIGLKSKSAEKFEDE